jgi:hypothetical protein
MYWNNRIVRTVARYEHAGQAVIEPFFEVSEVFYNDKGEPCGYTNATVGGETLEEVRKVYERMAEALANPVLDAETDFGHDFNEDLDDEFA